MNIELIRHNIRQLEAQLDEGQPEQACRRAFALARLLLQSPSQTPPQGLYTAYAGAAVCLRECFEELLERYEPEKDLAQMAQKLRQVNADIAECAKDREAVEAAHEALLSRRQELEKEKQALEEQKSEAEGLVALREQELPALRREIEEKERLLREIGQACEEALREKQRWGLVLDEDNRLICSLPDDLPDREAGAVIAAAKEYAQQARLSAEEGDEWLRKVIRAVDESRNRMREAPEG